MMRCCCSPVYSRNSALGGSKIPCFYRLIDLACFARSGMEDELIEVVSCCYINERYWRVA
jgi:hypothetical protein